MTLRKIWMEERVPSKSRGGLWNYLKAKDINSMLAWIVIASLPWIMIWSRMVGGDYSPPLSCHRIAKTPFLPEKGCRKLSSLLREVNLIRSLTMCSEPKTACLTHTDQPQILLENAPTMAKAGRLNLVPQMRSRSSDRDLYSYRCSGELSEGWQGKPG